MQFLVELSSEVAKSLMGDSKFTPDILSMAINNTQNMLEQNEQKLASSKMEIDNQEGAMKKLDYYYSKFRSWADEFDSAPLEQKKMIVCQLIKQVRVGKGYTIDIEFNMDYEQFLMV